MKAPKEAPSPPRTGQPGQSRAAARHTVPAARLLCVVPFFLLAPAPEGQSGALLTQAVTWWLGGSAGATVVKHLYQRAFEAPTS
ncbi:hypothetical protein GCM10010195_39880 [Kitasatospora griseola]|nr:hypothetical protein GCM10010195_39880 [Kitasatospora griseola]